MPNPIPSGLAFAEIGRPGRVTKTRKQLYCLHLVWTLFTAVFVFLAPLDAIEPIGLLGWLPDLVGIFVSGLPEHLANVAVRYPCTGCILIVVHAVLWVGKSKVKKAAQEYAFQAWQRTPTAAPKRLPGPIPKVCGFVRIIECLMSGWLLKLIWSLVILFLFLVVLDLFCRPPHLADGLCTASTLAKTAVDSANKHNLRRLAHGEKVQVTMRSDRVRNETGIWLDKDMFYTARYMGSCDWRDKERTAGPHGFRFEKNLVRLPRFWWMEWMRPYRKGLWFQVVGRIDRNPEVFPIFHRADAATLDVNEFQSPADGELVLLVNDAFYFNNHGVMTIEVGRCR